MLIIRKVGTYFLLSLAKLSSPREIYTEQRHDAVNDLVEPVRGNIWWGAEDLTSSLKSLSSAKRIEHSLMSSI